MGWEDVCQHFPAAVAAMPSRAQDPLPGLSGGALRAAALRTPLRTSAGVDGLGIAALKMLPAPVWDALAKCLEQVEQGGDWPLELLQGRVVLIAKGTPMAGIAKPGDLRPITVLAQVVRLWGRARMVHLRPWVATWALPAQAGLPGNPSSEGLLWESAVEVEQVRLRGGLCVGVSFDLAKAFDSVEWSVVRALAAHTRAPQGPLQAALRLYEGLVRFFQAPGARVVSGGTAARRGVPQGCGLAPVMMALVARFWAAHLLTIDFGPARPHVRLVVDDLHLMLSYDDATPVTQQRAQLALEVAVAESLRLLEAIGHAINVQKCKAWTTCPVMATGVPGGVLCPDGSRVPWATSFRDLGGHVESSAAPAAGGRACP